MSQENVEVVRRVFEAAGRRDTTGVLALYHPEVEWDTSGTVPGDVMGRSVYRGHDGVRTFFREFYEAWEKIEYNLEELVDADDQVVSVLTIRGRGRASGIELERHTTGVWTIHDGKIVRVIWFPTRQDALEAVGRPA
jgi:ketosteroid isomerase-like protein